MVVALEWVERTNAPFGGRYHVRHHDDNWALWLPRSGVPEDALLTYVARAWTRARASLVSIAEPEPSKPLIILLFDDHDDYYRYLSEFYPEGEWGSSSGVLVRDGFPHIALAPNTVAGLEQAIAHELGHLCLVGLELPQWLDEGLAELSRDTFDSRAHIPMDARRAEATRDVWHRNGLDDFWSGSAFHRADEMQQASYALADIITRSIASTHAARLASFVRDARCDDHGEASARKHLGTTLSDIAGRFLGPGEWSPPGVRLATKMREAYSLVREGRYTDALAAYEAVLTRAPNTP